MPTKTNAQPPEQEDKLILKKPSPLAGGLNAIKEASKHMMREMGASRGLKTLFKVNQKEGFDCPGCAWPDPDDHRSSLGEYCENGAKAVAEEATLKRVDPAFFAKYSIEDLGDESDFWLGKQGRLTHPMYLKEGATYYEPIKWDAAFKMIAEELNALTSPDEAIFYTSGRTSNEAAFLYQLFVRHFGTNNLPDCSNMCHESSGQGLSKTLGIGKGSVTLEDIHQAEVVLVVGQNPGTNHPRMLTALQKCKRNGGKIVTINPLPETGLMRFAHPQKPMDILKGGVSLTDIFLQVSINEDIALAKALMLLMLEAEEKSPGTVLDKDFINKKTEGFEAFIQNLKKHDYQTLVQNSGVAEERIRATADLLIQHKKIIICWAMGLTQHKNGVANIQEMVNILLLKGSIGKPGAGTCPVRGHSNVQGNRTVGIWESPKQGFLDKLEEVFKFKPPQHHGLNTVQAIEAMHEGKAKVFFALGGNFISATPDTEFTAEALRTCSLTVHVSTKLNRSHIVHGERALILPCLGRTEVDVQSGQEQFVSVENSMGIVHQSRGHLAPASEYLLSEPVIVAKLAAATLKKDSKVDWEDLVKDYDQVRDIIEACVPGFENYNERVRKPSGFYLPNGAREAKFNTQSGKAHFTINQPPSHELGEEEFMMMTIRSHDQYNTTIYGLDDRYRGIFNARRIVLMNEDDMEYIGVQAQQIVDLHSYFMGEKREAHQFKVVPYDIPPGCVATYFPEANVLVPIKSKADGSDTPASKSVIVKIVVPNS